MSELLAYQYESAQHWYDDQSSLDQQMIDHLIECHICGLDEIRSVVIQFQRPRDEARLRSLMGRLSDVLGDNPLNRRVHCQYLCDKTNERQTQPWSCALLQMPVGLNIFGRPSRPKTCTLKRTCYAEEYANLLTNHLPDG